MGGREGDRGRGRNWAGQAGAGFDRLTAKLSMGCMPGTCLARQLSSLFSAAAASMHAGTAAAGQLCYFSYLL